MPINRDTYFDMVRAAPFGGSLSEDQVEGQEALLSYWEEHWEGAETISDRRWLAYVLATAKWETAHTMQPIEEYGKGEGREYGNPDPETGQTYYGRGYVQLTWRENYERATDELDLSGTDDLEQHADKALDAEIAASVIFEGMADGWFTGKYLAQYFSADRDDPKNARQIVNGNDCDDEIAAIHQQFLAAVNAAYVPDEPASSTEEVVVQVVLRVSVGATVQVVGATLVTGADDAAEKGTVAKDHQPKRQGRDQSGKAAKAGGRDRA